MSDLKTIARMLRAAKCPEDVFGADADEIDTAFKQLARLVHPDRQHGSPAAQDAMGLLNALHDQALRKVASGTWGKAVSTTTIAAGQTYVNVAPLAPGDICDVFLGSYGVDKHAVIKVARDPRDADLVRNEASVLRALGAVTGPEASHFQRYIPRLIEEARLTVGGATRAANMLEHVEGGHTLRHLIAHFGAALDARHVAWIWKRLLEGLDWIHRQGYVHGGITPDHVLVFPHNHGAKILDWSYAVKSGGTLKAISSAHRALYPAEVLAKKPVTPGADLHMVARCMEACFAGARGGQVMPRLFRGLIDACTLPAAHRYQDAFEVREELKKHLRMLFGPPKFVEMRL